ncbi:MAG TPA: thioredoxin family protein, partial [Actinomycetota bacterium]|nr:thioredoxin family protein [Actinomycetota bacterium]
MRAGEPFVVVFATPKFCTSEVCGPTLDVAKVVAKDFPDVTWIHVEVYTNLDDPSDLKVVPAVKKWGLPTEPWVFVVNERGRVVAKYEGTVAATELEEELANL